MEGVGPHYQIVVRKKGYIDDVEVMVEFVDQTLVDNFRALKLLEEKVRNRLRSVLQIDVRVKLVEPKTLERFTGKARRVIDLRNKE